MTERRTVAQCRWAESTLFLAHPYWTDAEAYPWSCIADGDPEVVEDTGRCAACGRWSARRPSACACREDGTQASAGQAQITRNAIFTRP